MALHATSFDTGIVITNASAEPFGKPQAGMCDVHFFGQVAGGGLAPPTTSVLVEPGAQYIFSLSGVAPGFTGYLVVECSFDDAHGVAMITDLRIRNIAACYVAQRLPNRADEGKALPMGG